MLTMKKYYAVTQTKANQGMKLTMRSHAQECRFEHFHKLDLDTDAEQSKI